MIRRDSKGLLRNLNMAAQIGSSAAAARAHEELYAYWAGLRTGPRLPGRGDIKPEDLKRLNQGLNSKQLAPGKKIKVAKQQG